MTLDLDTVLDVVVEDTTEAAIDELVIVEEDVVEEPSVEETAVVEETVENTESAIDELIIEEDLAIEEVPAVVEEDLVVITESALDEIVIVDEVLTGEDEIVLDEVSEDLVIEDEEPVIEELSIVEEPIVEEAETTDSLSLVDIVVGIAEDSEDVDDETTAQIGTLGNLAADAFSFASSQQSSTHMISVLALVVVALAAAYIVSKKVQKNDYEAELTETLLRKSDAPATIETV